MSVLVCWFGEDDVDRMEVDETEEKKKRPVVVFGNTEGVTVTAGVRTSFLDFVKRNLFVLPFSEQLSTERKKEGIKAEQHSDIE